MLFTKSFRRVHMCALYFVEILPFVEIETVSS